MKFRTEFIDHNTPHDFRMEDLKFWCREFQTLNLTPLYKHRSLGNLSFRLNEHDDAFIITASALTLKDDLTDDSFVLVHSYDFDGGIVAASGTREPSSESMLHFGIYNKRKDVNAIFHGHSGKILHSADALKLTTTEKFEEYGSRELVESVLIILENTVFIVMKDHGFLSLGATMQEAGERAIGVYREALLLYEQRNDAFFESQTH